MPKYLKDNNTYCVFDPDRLSCSGDIPMEVNNKKFPTSCFISRSYGEAAIRTLEENNEDDRREYGVQMTSFEKQVTRELGRSAINALGF
jgi:hypothetical protein